LVDIEKGLADIARRTGGLGIANPSSIRTAMEAVRDSEDNIYTLIYTEKNPAVTGELDIRVNNKNYHVYPIIASGDFSQYIKSRLDSQTPSVHFGDVTFKNKKINITIVDFLIKEIGKKKTGSIAVRIYIKDNRGEKILFDQEKTMLPQKDTVQISLEFSWLKKGSYEIGVHVNDLLTGKSAIKSIETSDF
jgi:hypothetical protein